MFLPLPSDRLVERFVRCIVGLAFFGLGIATVLVVLAFATRQVFTRMRGKLLSAGAGGKRVLGTLLALVGLLILTGGDHIVEGVIVTNSPAWLTDLTTSI